MLQKPFGQSARTLLAKASIGRTMVLKRILLVGTETGLDGSSCRGRFDFSLGEKKTQTDLYMLQGERDLHRLFLVK